MKLSLEQHAGLDKIASCFEKIEAISENTSDEDLFQETFRQNRNKSFSALKKNQVAISEMRQQIFRQHDSMVAKHSIVNLSVIINEERF